MHPAPGSCSGTVFPDPRHAVADDHPPRRRALDRREHAHRAFVPLRQAGPPAAPPSAAWNVATLASRVFAGSPPRPVPSRQQYAADQPAPTQPRASGHDRAPQARTCSVQRHTVAIPNSVSPQTIAVGSARSADHRSSTCPVAHGGAAVGRRESGLQGQQLVARRALRWRRSRVGDVLAVLCMCKGLVGDASSAAQRNREVGNPLMDCCRCCAIRERGFIRGWVIGRDCRQPVPCRRTSWHFSYRTGW